MIDHDGITIIGDKIHDFVLANDWFEYSGDSKPERNTNDSANIWNNIAVSGEPSVGDENCWRALANDNYDYLNKEDN